MTEYQLSWLPGRPRRAVIDKQGQKAAFTGRQAEDAIASIMKGRGYVVERQVEIGTSIYGSPLYVDFVVRGVEGYKPGLIIESKWQSVEGSVDEKYPFMLANIQSRYKYPTIVVLGGGGMRDGAVAWFKRQVDGSRLVAVLRFEEFMLWTMENL